MGYRRTTVKKLYTSTKRKKNEKKVAAPNNKPRAYSRYTTKTKNKSDVQMMRVILHARYGGECSQIFRTFRATTKNTRRASSTPLTHRKTTSKMSRSLAQPDQRLSKRSKINYRTNVSLCTLEELNRTIEARKKTCSPKSAQHLSHCRWMTIRWG